MYEEIDKKFDEEFDVSWESDGDEYNIYEYEIFETDPDVKQIKQFIHEALDAERKKVVEEILNKLDGKIIYGVCDYDTEKELEYISINKEHIKEIIQS